MAEPTEKIPLTVPGYGPKDYIEIVPRVTWAMKRRAQAQCWITPEGYNTLSAYLALPEDARPEAEIFDEGKFDMLLMGYAMRGGQITIDGKKVKYTRLEDWPDEVIDFVWLEVQKRKGLPPGGTFRPGSEAATGVSGVRGDVPGAD